MAGRPISRKQLTEQQLAVSQELKKQFGSVQEGIFHYLVDNMPVDEVFTSHDVANGMGIHRDQVSGPLNRFKHSRYRIEKAGDSRHYVLREVAQAKPVLPVGTNGDITGPAEAFKELKPIPAYVLQQDGTEFLMWINGQLWWAKPFGE